MRTTLKSEWVKSIEDVPAEDWDSCIAGHNPFVQHAYLTAVERYGVAAAVNGYLPRHLLIRDEAGQLVAAAPTYIKDHSDAEIGSDFGWGLAHGRAIGPYYPKLQIESPVTPTPGPRLLVRLGSDEDQGRDALLVALQSEVLTSHRSSLHVNFLRGTEWRYLKERGFLCDFGIRFAWNNAGYGNFEEFLSDLKSERRGMIRRERREFKGTHLAFDRIEGTDITTALIDDFVPLYISTYQKYGTPVPLSAAVLHHLRDTLSNCMMFTTARLNGVLVAAVMFMSDADTLYALHWGTRIDQRFLHYELTYYQGIEFAIERGFQRFDAGPVGAHKSPRGLLAVPSLHAHWFANADFARSVARGIRSRAVTVRAQIKELDRLSAIKPALQHRTARDEIYAAL